MSVWLEALSWLSMLAGSLVLLVTGLGVLTLPEYYSRLHATSITDTLGAALVLFGLAVQAGWSLATAKLVMVMLFLMITGPAASHALVKTAALHDLSLPPRRRQEDGDAGAD
ncbi:MAG TPA: monovalent cation/H(+) antiporter subunit G [Thermoanaerobaculia bacterium]